jgi:hypothetical protein
MRIAQQRNAAAMHVNIQYLQGLQSGCLNDDSMVPRKFAEDPRGNGFLEIHYLLLHESLQRVDSPS